MENVLVALPMTVGHASFVWTSLSLVTQKKPCVQRKLEDTTDTSYSKISTHPDLQCNRRPLLNVSNLQSQGKMLKYTVHVHVYVRHEIS